MKLRHRKGRLIAQWSVYHELLAKAQRVLGARKEAEEWLGRPAIALNSRCPRDVTATPEGAAIVRTLLDRLEQNVYT